MLKVLLIITVVLAITNATNVERCIHHAGNLPGTTRIDGCTNPPCVFPQLSEAVIHLTFTAPHQLSSMRTLATVYLGIIPVPYDLGASTNTCNFLNVRCPVGFGTIVQYTLRMFIHDWFPVGTSASIEFRIVDQSNSPVICFRVPIIVGRANRFIAGNKLPFTIGAAEQ